MIIWTVFLILLGLQVDFATRAELDVDLFSELLIHSTWWTEHTRSLTQTRVEVTLCQTPTKGFMCVLPPPSTLLPTCSEKMNQDQVRRHEESDMMRICWTCYVITGSIRDLFSIVKEFKYEGKRYSFVWLYVLRFHVEFQNLQKLYTHTHIS